ENPSRISCVIEKIYVRQDGMNQENLVVNPEQSAMVAEAQEAWFFLRRNVRMIGLIALGFAILALVLSLVLPAKYKGEAVVMLDPRKTNVFNIESLISSLPSENSVIRSQIDTIRSRAVIDRVIDQSKLMEDPDFNPSLRGTRWFLRLFA